MKAKIRTQTVTVFGEGSEIICKFWNIKRRPSLLVIAEKCIRSGKNDHDSNGFAVVARIYRADGSHEESTQYIQVNSSQFDVIWEKIELEEEVKRTSEMIMEAESEKKRKKI